MLKYIQIYSCFALRGQEKMANQGWHKILKNKAKFKAWEMPIPHVKKEIPKLSQRGGETRPTRTRIMTHARND